MSGDESDIDAAYNEDDWEPIDRLCPDCGSTVEARGWWDDPPSRGGACIGSQYRCPGCEWSDSQ